MINNWILTGDIHGSLERFAPARLTVRDPAHTSFLLLGDCGFNYYLNSQDEKLKQIAVKLGYNFYCVRGNHEARPQDVPGMELIYDENVQGNVYYQPTYPNIRYLLDGGFYNINNKNVLVIGGAYSVDKMHRLARGWQWFENEQLDADEREHILDCVKDFLDDGNKIDFVLTHTAPISCEPTDVFLSFIDQSSVDKTTEYWLQEIKDLLDESRSPYFWLFGHYHADMIIKDNVAMLYNQFINLDLIEDFSNPNVLAPDDFKVAQDYVYERESRGLPQL